MSSSQNPMMDDCRLITEMKSIQPYSTKDEYIYAMKEDLAEWFNSMYSTKLNVQNFIELLETGSLTCLHANNVTRAALKTHKFNQSDLTSANIQNIPLSNITLSQTPLNKLTLTPSGKSTAWSGDFLVYKSDARPQSFHARDNISNFIKWCRYIAKVRECLMFETDDLILRKNEKNFILCLLEVARFGSRFGIQVPTIIQLELEIEAEIEREVESCANLDPEPFIIKLVSPKLSDNDKEINIYLNDDLAPSKQDIKLLLSQISTDLAKSSVFKKQLSRANSLIISMSKEDCNDEYEKKLNSNGSFDTSSLDESFEDLNCLNTNSNSQNEDDDKNKTFNDSLEDINFIEEDEVRQREQRVDFKEEVYLNKEHDCQKSSSCFSNENSPLLPSPLSTSISSTNSSEINKNCLNMSQNLSIENSVDQFMNLNIETDETLNAKPSSKIVKNLFAKSLNVQENSIRLLSAKKGETIRSRSTSGSRENLKANTMTYSLEQGSRQGQVELGLNTSQNNLHNHVCSIADRCTCEKQFPVVKLGEGKYRIGNTKNIVFIRILRNHIMVRVGGGWDTLENYLNKHDPCRCPGEFYSSFKQKNNDTQSTDACSSNIVLTPVTNSGVHNCQSSTSLTPFAKQLHLTSINNNPFFKFQQKTFISSSTKPTHQASTKGVDFTDAKLVVERDTQGKHIVGKILLISQPDDTTNPNLNKSISNNNLTNNSIINIQTGHHNHHNTNNKLVYASSNTTTEEMSGLFKNTINYYTTPSKHSINHNFNNYNNESSSISNTKQILNNSPQIKLKSTKPAIPNSTSLNSIQNSVRQHHTQHISSPSASNNRLSIQHQSPLSKTESGLKNKMKKLINRIPTNSPLSARKSHPEPHRPHQTLLTSTTTSIKTTTTGYSSYNEDSSSDFLENPTIYTDTRLPARLLKKYEKTRATSEAIIEADIIPTRDTLIQQINEYDEGVSDSILNNTTSSPKPPPRIKKKYRKSRTTELSRYSLEDNENDPDIDSLDGDLFRDKNESITEELTINKHNYTFNLNYLGEQINKEEKLLSPIQSDGFKLNDSLESIDNKNSNQTINNNIEDDSLLMNDNDNQGPSLSMSLSTASSISNLNDLDQIEYFGMNKTKRAQWDKKRQEFDYKSQVFSSKVIIKTQLNPKQAKPSMPHSSTLDTINSGVSSSKKSRNLSLAKEQLYEMKKTIDAKLNLDPMSPKHEIPIPKTLIPNPIRTTPRKVKKRSGERSLTTGIFTDNDTTEVKPKIKPSRPITPIISNKNTSASLHNLTNLNTESSSSRQRRDSCASTASSGTCLSSIGVNNISLNSTPNEFKENKAYELRKKSTLLNKIIIKTQQNDPIYSRSHPVCSEIVEQQVDQLSVHNEQTARKRLFAKKNERSFDPNLSLGSNVSSTFSSNSIPTSSSMNFNLKTRAPQSPKAQKSPTKRSPVKTQPTSRSKSNSDLCYELERTNSTQDLIELINNCETPAGDLSKYKILMSECENFDPKLNKKSKQLVNKQSRTRVVNTANRGVVGDVGEVKGRESRHKRSRSLPSYSDVPMINISDYDEGARKAGGKKLQ